MAIIHSIDDDAVETQLVKTGKKAMIDAILVQIFQTKRGADLVHR